MKLALALVSTLVFATGCAVVPAEPVVYAPGPVVYGAPGPVYGAPVYVEQPYPVYVPGPVYVQPHRRGDGWRDRGGRFDGGDRGGRFDRRSTAPSAPVATNPRPTPGQVAAQRDDPNMRFERPGVGGGPNWAATSRGWGWSPVQADRP